MVLLTNDSSLNISRNHMGLDNRKPNFRVLGTTKAQPDQCLCFSRFGKYHIQVAKSEISTFKLVSVAEQAGLNLTFLETLKTSFLWRGPHDIITQCRCTSVPEDCFILDNSADIHYMPHSAAFHLSIQCLPMYPSRGFQFTKC